MAGASANTRKIADLVSHLRKLEQEGFTGRLELTLHFNKGGITRLVAMQEVSTDLLPKTKKGEPN
jgi:hypothetical protein